jgi:hypothetical protein
MTRRRLARVSLTTEHVPVVSVAEQLLELRLRLRLGVAKDHPNSCHAATTELARDALDRVRLLGDR